MTDNTLNEVESSALARAYIVCALWSSVDDDGVPMDDNYDSDDLTAETAVKMANDCFRFLLEVKSAGLLDAETPEQMGHDFWLTRNHHGAGFWDRGLGDAGKILTTLAQGYREVSLFATADGQVICE